MFLRMQGRTSMFSLVCQLFLLISFVCVPIADNSHAIRMSQTSHGDTQTIPHSPVEKISAMDSMPCHESMMAAAEADTSVQLDAGNSNQQKPCCPNKQCSPQNCLMHFAIASMPTLEIIPQSPLDSRIFLDADFHLVVVPVTERFRPPIA